MQVRAIWRQVEKNRSDQRAADQQATLASAGPAAQSIPLANLAGQSSGSGLGNGLNRQTSNVGVTRTGLKNKGTGGRGDAKEHVKEHASLRRLRCRCRCRCNCRCRCRCKCRCRCRCRYRCWNSYRYKYRYGYRYRHRHM